MVLIFEEGITIPTGISVKTLLMQCTTGSSCAKWHKQSNENFFLSFFNSTFNDRREGVSGFQRLAMCRDLTSKSVEGYNSGLIYVVHSWLISSNNHTFGRWVSGVTLSLPPCLPASLFPPPTTAKTTTTTNLVKIKRGCGWRGRRRQRATKQVKKFLVWATNYVTKLCF